MNLENLAHGDYPFNHWVFSNCLEEGKRIAGIIKKRIIERKNES